MLLKSRTVNLVKVEPAPIAEPLQFVDDRLVTQDGSHAEVIRPAGLTKFKQTIAYARCYLHGNATGTH